MLHYLNLKLLFIAKSEIFSRTIKYEGLYFLVIVFYVIIVNRYTNNTYCVDIHKYLS